MISSNTLDYSGVGPKTAQRLAYHMLEPGNRHKSLQLAM